MTAGKTVYVDLVFADELAAQLAVLGMEVERHAVNGEAVTQVMAAGIPLFADDGVHQVPLLMRRRPRASASCTSG
jgi:hypothetical protein